MEHQFQQLQEEVHTRAQPQADPDHDEDNQVSHPPEEEAVEARTAKYARKTPICYLCGQEGHIKPMCPKNTARL